MTEILILSTIILLALVKDYIPSSEEDFNDWQSQFMDVLNLNLVAWGIAPIDVAPLTALQTTWIDKYNKGKPEANPRSSDRIAKNDARKAFAKELRKFVKKFINENAAVTNDNRRDLGVTVYDTTRTRVAVPTVQPAGSVRKINPHEHVLQIKNPETPNSNAKPVGVRATRVFRFVGTAAPANVSQYQLVGSATRHLFTSAFAPEDVGKKAFYIFQYENTRGETGPLSDPLSGGIA